MNDKNNENQFVFSASEIRQAGTYSAELNILPSEFADAFPGRDVLKKLSASLEFNAAGDEILLNGKISASLALDCSRCGKSIIKSFSDVFDESFPYSVEYINVRENIRETVSLMEPMKVLCSEKCKGRCPHCGKDLNEGTCSCVQENFSPFAALKNFRPGKK